MEIETEEQYFLAIKEYEELKEIEKPTEEEKKMKIEYYESQLEGCGSKEEIKSIVDEAYQDEELSTQNIQDIKDYAQEMYDLFLEEEAQDRFEREGARRHGEDYLTDDELGLTQM